MHTTGDGRLAVDIKPHSWHADFYLINPEKLTTHFVDASDGTSDLLSSTSAYQVDKSEFVSLIETDSAGNSIGEIRHITIVDKTREFDQGDSYTNNPVAESGNDIYYITIHSSAEYNSGPNRGRLRQQFTPIKVTVANPKTASAYISDITILSGKTSGSYIKANGLLEVRFVNDGKLMVARIGTDNHRFYRPNNGNLATGYGYADIVYGYSSDGTLNGDSSIGAIDGFDNLIPISYAPRDPRLNTTYGFAMFPFRDGNGDSIRFGNDLQATYPWIDSEGTNLAFTTIGTVLNPDRRTRDARYTNSKYDPSQAADLREETSITRGVSMVGLWTQGKIVTMDNSLNNTDYGIGCEDAQHRVVTLYDTSSASTASLPILNGKIRVGSGRDNGVVAPPGGTGNTTFFDSSENKLNHDENLMPVIPQDVVWWVSNGKSTAQFAFDDYLNVNSYIISKMNGALNWVASQSNRSRMRYWDGWNNNTKSFNGIVKVANDATAVDTQWAIPRFGRVIGSGRIEPIAHGGIEGKGFWLDGSNGIEYPIPGNQPQAVNDSDWYVGIFVDQRSIDDNIVRSLVAFPDGSKIELVGRNQVRYRKSDGVAESSASIPGDWGRNEWAHLGFQILDGGSTIEFYHNGFLANRRSLSEQMFQMTGGTLTVGHVDGASRGGFRGWIDDFKVFAQSFGPEVCANHARGTLVGIAIGDNSMLEVQADLYSASIGEAIIDDILYHSGQTTYDRYAVHYDYTQDLGAHLNNIPASVTGIREDVLFPESPLFKNAHRPDSIGNSFCFNCHSENNPSSVLQFGALSLDNMHLAKNDTRRQPMQSPRRVFGFIPQDWKGSGLPPVDILTDNDGKLIDEYVLSDESPSARKVVTFSLVDAVTNTVIRELESGQTIDYNDIAEPIGLSVRANLDAGQGSVVFLMEDSATGVEIHSNIVNEAPYAQFGSSGGSTIYSGVLSDGTFDFTASPFRNDDGSGQQGNFNQIINVTFQDMPSVVADYQDDYQGTSPLAGWSYLKCNLADLGNQSTYGGMTWDASNSYYKTNANGHGTFRNDGGKARFNKVIIAAYQIQTAGDYLLNPHIALDYSANSNGVDVSIYVENTEVDSFSLNSGGSANFGTDLGGLAVGDTVYVCVGPRDGDDVDDYFYMDFSLSRKVN